MSDLRATNFKGRTSGSVPNMPDGVVVGSAVTISSSGIDVGAAGIITATTFSGTVSSSTGSFSGDVDIADKIVHTGDTDTAIRFPAADTFTVETGGSEALRVDSSQNTTFGTTSESSTSVNITASTSGNCLLSFNDTNSGQGGIRYFHSTDHMQFHTADAERLRIDSTGRIGVGTDSFNDAAEVMRVQAPSGQNNTLFTIKSNSTSGASILNFGDDDFNEGRIIYDHSDNSMQFRTDDSERLRVDSSGRVLIGTSTEGEAGADNLTIADSGHCGITLRSGTTNNGAIYFSDATSGNAEFDGYVLYTQNNRALLFGTAQAEQMRIDSSGKVGININDPGDYNSSGNELVLGNTGNNGGMTIVSGTGNNGHIFFADGTASGAENRGIIKYEHGNDAMAFNTAESERLRLTSGGELLVGHGSVINNMKFGGSSDFGSHAEIVGANKGFGNGLAILNYDASATIPALLKLATSRNDTAGSNTIVGNSGDNCASIQFMGNDGTRFIDLARIDAVTDGTVGSNDMPGRLSFQITADGGSVVTERMRISKNGEQQHFGTSATNINIANTASAGNSHEFFYCQHSSTGLANGTNSFRVSTNGNVQNTNNSYGSISDQNLKENIVDATSQWNDIKGLRVRKYNFRENTGHETYTQIGLIAQEAESVSPGLVQTTPVKEGQTILDADGNQLESIKSINYSVLYMKSVKALQESIDRIETLEAKVAALEGS